MAITGSIKADLSDGIPLIFNSVIADAAGPSFIYSVKQDQIGGPLQEPSERVLKGGAAGPLQESPILVIDGNRSELASSFFGDISKIGSQGVIGALKGIAMGGPISYLSDGTFGRHMQTGVTQSISDGSPTAPCLQLSYPGFWRFRWTVRSGIRSIYINTKQLHFLSGSFPYVNVFYPPSMVVKANPAVGLNTDISASVADAQTWTTIGPLSFTATAYGIVWVELWNNNTNEYNTPCLFDRITTT